MSVLTPTRSAPSALHLSPGDLVYHSSPSDDDSQSSSVNSTPDPTPTKRHLSTQQEPGTASTDSSRGSSPSDSPQLRPTAFSLRPLQLDDSCDAPTLTSPSSAAALSSLSSSSALRSPRSHLKEIEAGPVENVVLKATATTGETAVQRAVRMEEERLTKARREEEDRKKAAVLTLSQMTRQLKASGGATPTASAVSPRTGEAAGGVDGVTG